MDKLNKTEFLKNLKPTSPQQIHDKLLNLTENALKVCKQSEKNSINETENPQKNSEKLKTAENENNKTIEEKKENIPSESIMDCLHLLKFIDTDNSTNLQDEHLKQRNIKGFDLDEVTTEFISDCYGLNSSQEIIFNNLELSSDNDYIYVNVKVNDFFLTQSNYMKQSKYFNKTIALSRFLFVGYKTKIHQKEYTIEDMDSLKKILLYEIDQEAILLNKIFHQVKLAKQKTANVNNKNINENNNNKDSNNTTNTINNKDNNKDTIDFKKTTKSKLSQNETVSLIEKNYPVPKSKVHSINFLHKPYSTEKHRTLIRKHVDKSDYFLESLKYTEFINEINYDNLLEKLLKIYTFEGFIYKRINWLLKHKKELYTNLNIFYIMLLSAISIKSESAKNIIQEKNLWNLDKKLNKNYLEFYRGTFLDDVAINYFIDNLSKKKVKYYFLFRENKDPK